MAADPALNALRRASQLLDQGSYAEVGGVVRTLRADAATTVSGAHLDIAEELLLECVRLRAQSEEHQIAAEQALRRCHVLRGEVISILQLGVDSGASERSEARDQPADDESGRPSGPDRAGRADVPPVLPGDERLRVAVHFFGEFEVYAADHFVDRWHGLKSKAVLQLLVLNAPRPVSADALIDALWPDADGEAGRRNLHQAMYMLRKSLRGGGANAGGAVVFDRPEYRLSPKVELWSDVAEFEQSIAAGRKAAAREKVSGLGQLETAVRLYRGEFLAGALYDDWTFPYRERYRRAFTGAATILLDIYAELGRLEPSIELARRALEFDPCNEVAHRHLIMAHEAQGERHLAMQQYRICERDLARNLGVEPSPETQRLMSHLQSVE